MISSKLFLQAKLTEHLQTADTTIKLRFSAVKYKKNSEKLIHSWLVLELLVASILKLLLWWVLDVVLRAKSIAPIMTILKSATWTDSSSLERITSATPSPKQLVKLPADSTQASKSKLTLHLLLQKLKQFSTMLSGRVLISSLMRSTTLKLDFMSMQDVYGTKSHF